MNSDQLTGVVAAIARRTMEIARSQINVAVGNTLVVPVSLAGIQLPADISDVLRSVAISTGFRTEYSEGELFLSWTNVGAAIPRPETTVLEDIRGVLEEIKDLQIKAAQDNKWSRQDVLTAIGLLLAIVLGILGQVEYFASNPGSSASHGSATVQTHASQPTPANIQPGPSPSPNDP
ncbi:MAG TPA: hypothetical protein VIY52_06985 [Streptosporangiaceae bacterium]